MLARGRRVRLLVHPAVAAVDVAVDVHVQQRVVERGVERLLLRVGAAVDLDLARAACSSASCAAWATLSKLVPAGCSASQVRLRARRVDVGDADAHADLLGAELYVAPEPLPGVGRPPGAVMPPEVPPA